MRRSCIARTMSSILVQPRGRHMFLVIIKEKRCRKIFLDGNKRLSVLSACTVCLILFLLAGIFTVHRG